MNPKKLEKCKCGGEGKVFHLRRNMINEYQIYCDKDINRGYNPPNHEAAQNTQRNNCYKTKLYLSINAAMLAWNKYQS